MKWSRIGVVSGSLVVNLEPKPGVAFGNVKTHKHDNPLRLITSCCGTTIERLSAFTEFYLKPLSQSLPSFVKDSMDFINKLEDLDAKGQLPEGSPLVSWDVVSMFPKIDNNLGIPADRRALNSRSVNIPSTDCLVEAVASGLIIASFLVRVLFRNMARPWDRKRPAVMQIWRWVSSMRKPNLEVA